MNSTHLLVTRDKVQRYAKQFFNVVQITDSGGLSIPFESTHIFVETADLSLGDEEDFKKFREENDISKTIVNVFAVVLVEVKPSADLFRWIAVEGQDFDFGGFRALPDDSGTFEVQYQYRLAGDTLDPGELKNALAITAFTANNWDDELKKKFGGKRVEDIRS